MRAVIGAISKVKFKVGGRGSRLGQVKVGVGRWLQAQLVQRGCCHGDVWHHFAENAIAADAGLLLAKETKDAVKASILSGDNY